MKSKLLLVWKDISAVEFDYIIDPINSDRTAPTLAFKPMRGSGGGSVGAKYAYVTVNGTVVHGSKINSMLWAVFGRYWGYSTGELMDGAEIHELKEKWQFDRESSQAAISLGCNFMDVRQNQGVSTLLRLMLETDWTRLVDPVDLIEEKLWPCLDHYDEEKSIFQRPRLTTKP